jgi:hypothetical protein
MLFGNTSGNTLGTWWEPLENSMGNTFRTSKEPHINMLTKQTKCTLSYGNSHMACIFACSAKSNLLVSKSFCRPRRWVGVGRRWSDPFPGGISKRDVTAIPKGGGGGGWWVVLDKDKIRRGNKSEQGLKEVKQPSEHQERVDERLRRGGIRHNHVRMAVTWLDRRAYIFIAQRIHNLFSLFFLFFFFFWGWSFQREIVKCGRTREFISG